MAKHSDTKRKATAARLESSRARRVAGICKVILLAAVFFVCGFLLRGNDALMLSLGFGSSSDAHTNPGMTVAGSTYDSIAARVAEIEGTLKSESMDEVDLSTLTPSVINALLGSLDDPYVRYLDADRYQAYLKESANVDTEGIGVILAEYNHLVYVADVFEGSVAEASGVRQGDVVIAVDGEPIGDKTASEVTNSLFRQEGDSVIVTWQHRANLDAESGEEFSTTMQCTKHSQVNVTTELSDKVGYIKLMQLTQNSSELVSSAISDLTTQGAEAFILDLRDCSGGFLTQAVNIADLFMKSGTIVQIETAEGTTTKSASATQATDAPLAVLVNDKTAGAAEVIAAALKDSQRAELLGTSTMGKGSVQVVRELSFGGALRYTAAVYKSPLGYEIDRAGVSPSVVVNANDDTDNQKTFAVDFVSARIGR